MRPLVLSILALGACASVTDLPGPADEALCRELLETQAAAWNSGDIEAFCAGYWESEQTVFAGATSVEVGWEGLLARYKRRYPDRAAMGHLTFSHLRFQPLDEQTLTATGRWRLQRKEDSPSGRFVLVFRRFEHGWKIVLDYTT